LPRSSVVRATPCGATCARPAQRERAEQAERLRKPLLVGAGVAVALFGTAWVIQRRQLVALREAMLATPDSSVAASLLSAPASIGPDHTAPARRPPR